MNNFFQGFITGLALGGLAGLMNAQQSGEKTRKQLKAAYADLKVDLNQVDNDFQHLNNAIQRTTKEAKETMDLIKHLTTQTKQKFIDETEPRIRRIEEEVDQLNSDLDKEISPLKTSLKNH